jgi:hypothetical protein
LHWRWRIYPPKGGQFKGIAVLVVLALTGRPEVRPTKTASLADLYDPLSMPPALVRAHAELNRAVVLCYLPQPFTSERQRV